MRTAVSPARVPRAIRRRLAGLRWSVVAWILVDALAAVCVVAAVFVGASLLLDRTLRLDRPQRFAVLAFGAAAAGVMAWRRLGRPLRHGLSDDALARLVEARHGELGESLLAAVQFSRIDPSAAGCSEAMARAAVDLGVRRAAAIDFRDVLDRRRRARNLLVVGGAVAALAGASLIFPNTMGLWWRRNVLLAEVAWPQNTHLAVVGAEDGVIVCPRGDDLTVQVRADPDGVVPSVVALDHRDETGAWGSETMVMVGDTVFRSLFRNVLEPFRLRARGGDAVTPWHRVRLVERPVVDDLTLLYTPPAYVDPEPRPLPKNVGSYPVLAGSRVEVRGTASKDLRWARLRFGKEPIGDVQRVGKRGFRTELAGERLRSGVYAISLLDTTGLASRRPTRFSLKVRPDRRPVVRARLEGIGDLIVPRAVVPVRATLRDDFSVRKAELVYAAVVEAQGDTPARRVDFGGGEVPYGRKKVEAVHRLDCRPLDVPVGSHLTLRVEAFDNDTVGGPNVGTSGSFSLKVVTEDDLRAELLRREQEQRLEFERLLRDQRKLAENARALRAILSTPDRPFADEDRRLLAATEKRQRLVGGRCTAIADQVARILAEVENNRLEEDQQAVRDRLAGRVIEPLRDLARHGVVRAADLLEEARKTPEDDLAARRTALADAADEQDAVVAAMREVLRNMVKWEGYQEAVTLLRQVLRTQKEVNEKTIKEYQRRIRSIFDK